MSLASLLISFLLIGYYNIKYSETLEYRPVNGNGIDCRPPADCQYINNNQIETQLIDCKGQHNCQHIKPQRSQLNHCHNRNDCQNYANSGHNTHNSRNANQHLYRYDCQRYCRRYAPQRSQQMISMTALQVWNCDFGANDCGIHNQPNINTCFHLRPDTMEPIFGKSGLYYLDISKAQNAGARLITPYFPTNGCRYGCLTIEYILCGNSIENLYLIQQDVRNYCVLQKTNDHSYRWTTSSVTIDLSQSDPRFFIEVRFSRGFGFVGISDMTFKYGECERNEANECDLNRFIGTLL